MPNNTNSTNSITTPATDVTARKVETREVELLQHVLDKMGNPTWDLLIIGDGSGSGWAGACGWGGLLIDSQTRGRRFLYGAMDCGSVNFAESMPYIQALNWFDAVYGKERMRTRGFLNVHILTDSQVVATWGNRAMSPLGDIPRKHAVLWAGMKELRRLGYHCVFHWAKRMTTKSNWACDLLAGLARSEIKRAIDPTYVQGDVAQRAATALDNIQFCDPETGEPINPYQINPG